MHARRDVLRQGWVLILNDSEQCRHWLKIIVGCLPCEQFYGEASDAPYIRCCCNTGHFYNLWCHPVRRADNRQAETVVCLLQLTQFCSNSKISQLNQPLDIQTILCRYSWKQVLQNDSLYVSS